MSRRVVWSADARQDVHELVTYASEHDPEFAERLYDEIDAAAHALATYDTGRPGRLPGTREKSILTRRLILSYLTEQRDGQDLVIVLHVIHTSRDWPPGAPPND